MSRTVLLTFALSTAAACAPGTQPGATGAAGSIGAAAPPPREAAERLVIAGYLRVSTSSRQLQPRFVIRNHGADTVHLHYSSCSAGLRAYRDAARTGQPVWDEERWPNPPPGRPGHRACEFGLSPTFSIAPGDSVGTLGFQNAPNAAQLLGGSLPPGTYYFTARLSYFVRSARAGLVHRSARVAAGEARLGR